MPLHRQNQPSPASNSDSSEDVFLDLAEDADARQPLNLDGAGTDREQDQEQDDHDTAPRMPGQYPTRTDELEPSPPRASGNIRTPYAQSARHARHVSQPVVSSTYTTNIAAMRHGRYASRNIDLGTANPTTPGQRISYLQRYNASSTVAKSTVQNDSDSADSQVAPSTVWDELDVLKSRINHLESGGHRRSVSNAATASYPSGRPLTATTNPTTVSSSPLQLKTPVVLPPSPFVLKDIPADTHPTLQSALARAKPSLEPHLFRPLEAAVVDSLTLATMTAGATPGSANSGQPLSDRQLRRKIDGLCRNLTDLCIATCDTRPGVPQGQSDLARALPDALQHTRSVVGMDMRDTSIEVSSTRRASRASFSRLDSYRSARGLEVNENPTSPSQDRQDAQRTPSVAPRDYSKRYSGMYGAGQREQHQPAAITEEDRTVQAPSRAMTEIGGRTTMSSKLGHLRLGAQRSPSLKETLESRRRSAHIRAEELNETQSSVGSAQQSPMTTGTRGAASEVGGPTLRAHKRLSSSSSAFSPSLRLSNPLTRVSGLRTERRLVTE